MSRLARSLLVGLLLCTGVCAEVRTYKVPTYYIGISGNYLYPHSAADEVAGATYAKRYANPLVGAVGLGVVLEQLLYLGIRYEYWFAQREMMLASVFQTDTLKLQTLTFEMGYRSGNSRVFWMILGGVTVPLRVGVDSTAGVFTAESSRWGYDLRGVLGIRLMNFSSLLLEGGYHLRNLGKISAAGVPYIPGNPDLDLSGMFLGLGIWFHF